MGCVDPESGVIMAPRRVKPVMLGPVKFVQKGLVFGPPPALSTYSYVTVNGQTVGKQSPGRHVLNERKGAIRRHVERRNRALITVPNLRTGEVRVRAGVRGCALRVNGEEATVALVQHETALGAERVEPSQLSAAAAASRGNGLD